MNVDLGSFSFDHEGVSKGQLEHRTWRIAAEESLSDWTIVVSSVPRKRYPETTRLDEGYPMMTTQGEQREGEEKKEEEEEHNQDFEDSGDEEDADVTENALEGCEGEGSDKSVSRYHVHKAFLGCGPRHSLYFSRLFRMRGIVEAETSLSEIDLDHAAASAFPEMLDFIYSGDDLRVSTDTAVSLRHLSNYFGIREMFESVNRFISKDLTIGTALIYLREAIHLGDPTIKSLSIDVCSKNFGRLDDISVGRLPPQVFKEVVLSPLLNCESLLLSKRVARFCTSHPEEADEEFLRSATKEKRMPQISPGNALYLLQLGTQKPTAAEEESGHWVSFRKRCVNASINSWRDVITMMTPSEDQKEKNHNEGRTIVDGCEIVEYAGLAADAKIVLLEEALKLAANDLSVQKTSSNSEAVIMKRKMEAEAEKANIYKRELEKFVRLPLSHKFHNLPLSKCTYAENVASLSHGRTPPSAMPVGSPSGDKEGWLYTEDWSDQRWPVYYYKDSWKQFFG